MSEIAMCRILQESPLHLANRWTISWQQLAICSMQNLTRIWAGLLWFVGVAGWHDHSWVCDIESVQKQSQL